MYATLADLLEQMAESDLIALTDDTGTGLVDETAVERAVANGDALIDGYCGSRYDVPFDPVPELIRMFAVDLAIFNLYSRRTHLGEPPAIVSDRQKQVVAYLKRVQDGAANIGASQKSQDVVGKGALVSGEERIFTRTKMRGL